MNAPEYPYVYTDRNDPSHRTLVVNRLGGGTIVGIQKGDENEGYAYIPESDPAELHRLVEAILGRKVAAVIYEDELPAVEAGRGEDHAGYARSGGADRFADYQMERARERVALALHYEARDAVAKERERVEEAERAALIEEAKEAIRPLRFDPNTFITDVASLFVDNGWRPSSDEAGR